MRAFGSPRVRFAWPPIPPVTRALLIANVLLFLVTGINRRIVLALGMIPALFHDRGNLHLWTPLTYMFLHGSLGHLLFNLLGLWMFGAAIEERWGGARFLRFYLLCGLAGGLAYPLIAWSSPIPLVGASGAIYGLLAAFAMLWPNRKLYLYGVAPIKAKWFALGFGIFSFIAMFTAGGRTAHFAHLAGLGFGAAWLWLGPRLAGRWPRPGWATLRRRLRRHPLRSAPDPNRPPWWPPDDRTWH